MLFSIFIIFSAVTNLHHYKCNFALPALPRLLKVCNRYDVQDLLSSFLLLRARRDLSASHFAEIMLQYTLHTTTKNSRGILFHFDFAGKVTTTKLYNKIKLVLGKCARVSLNFEIAETFLTSMVKS